MSGLHRPVVVDTRAANLHDTRLTVRCVPGALVSPMDAGSLCRKVSTLFENQGATVQTTVGVGSADSLFVEAPSGEAAAPAADLIVELRSRQVHQANHPLSWVLSVFTFTLLPAVTESSFAQDVVIRDASGFVLVSDSLEGRLITRYGAGPWVGNAVLDLAREKENRLGGDTAERDLSTDLYRQLSQLVFNARVHWQVLEESAARRGVGGATP